MGTVQAERLQALLVAKREHDDAIAAVEQCLAAGALTVEEAGAQREAAAHAFKRAKEMAVLANLPQNGFPSKAACGITGVVASPGSRSPGTEAGDPAPMRGRGRGVGCKNKARTRTDDLSIETLRAISEEILVEPEISTVHALHDQVASSSEDEKEAYRLGMIEYIHKASKATSQCPKCNLDPLTAGTLARICTDRQLSTVGDKNELIERIQAGKKKVPEETQKKPRGATAYNLFLSKEIARLKQSDPLLSHQEVFKKAAANWAVERIRMQFEKLDNETGVVAREKAEVAFRPADPGAENRLASQNGHFRNGF